MSLRTFITLGIRSAALNIQFRHSSVASTSAAIIDSAFPRLDTPMGSGFRSHRQQTRHAVWTTKDSWVSSFRGSSGCACTVQSGLRRTKYGSRPFGCSGLNKPDWWQHLPVSSDLSGGGFCKWAVLTGHHTLWRGSSRSPRRGKCWERASTPGEACNGRWPEHTATCPVEGFQKQCTWLGNWGFFLSIQTLKGRF